jgi:hypothetical protein
MSMQPTRRKPEPVKLPCGGPNSVWVTVAAQGGGGVEPRCLALSIEGKRFGRKNAYLWFREARDFNRAVASAVAWVTEEEDS